MALEIYRKKRKFDVTSEPRGRKVARGGNRYVIQKHAASRLHYDLRLELDGVMKSWAVTRGPSLDPSEKRLAVHVEDHPIEYNTFEGTIPQGEYGGGTVMIWDRGRWFPEGDPHKGYAKGHLEFTLDGEKLHGRWHLVRMRSRDKDRHENWLLIKGKDEAARSGRSATFWRKSRCRRRPAARWTRSPRARAKNGSGTAIAKHCHSRPGVRSAGPANPTRIQDAVAGVGRFAKKEELQFANREDGRGKTRPKRPPRRAAKPIKGEGRSRGGSAQTFGPPPRSRRAADCPISSRQVLSRPVWPRCTTPRQAARIGSTRSNSTATASKRAAARSRQGQAAHAQSSSIGRIASNVSRKPSRRFRPRRRCSTANWSSRTTRAFRVSRCCRPI